MAKVTHHPARETNATTGKTYTYTYDNVGNITSKSDGTSTIAYTYGTDSDAGWSKLLTSYNGQPIDYDKIGNPVLYRGANLTWTGRQLNSYSKNGTSITYKYDADGLRGSKTVNNVKTTYQYLDGKLYYQETNGDDTYFYYDSYGNIIAIATYLSDGTAGYVFVGTNSLGDVNALYDGNGNLVVRYEYDAWGRVISETNANGNALTGTAATWNEINPFRYRGYYYDSETQLYYLQSRYYDPEVGRFVNSDSQLNSETLLGFNSYAYCENNPVIREDSSGLVWNFVVGGIIGGIVGGVVAAVNSYKSTGSVNIKKVAVGVVSGAVSGVVAASGLGVVAQACISVGVSVASSTLNQVIDITERDDLSYHDFDVQSVAVEAVLDGVTSLGGSVLGNFVGTHITKTAIKAADAYDSYLFKSFSAGMRKGAGKSASALVRQADKFLKQANYYDNVTKGISSGVGSFLSSWKLFV